MSTDTAVTFVHAATLEDFAGEPQEHLRARILDTLAATTARVRLPTEDVIRAYAAAHHDGDSATVLGTKAKNSDDEDNESLSEHGAVLVNAKAANALDVDDGHRGVKGHPAAVVIPPALAVAETTNATVGEFLTAVGIGYELAVRAGLAIHETADSYTGTGSWGAVGAAAAVARLRGLDASTTATALGIAEYHAPRTPILRGVELITSDDRVLTSDVTRAQSAREQPLSHAERRAKAADLFEPSLPGVTDHIERTLESPEICVTSLLDPWRS